MSIDADTEPDPETPQRVIAQLGAPSLQKVARLVATVAACAGDSACSISRGAP